MFSEQSLLGASGIMSSMKGLEDSQDVVQVDVCYSLAKWEDGTVFFLL